VQVLPNNALLQKRYRVLQVLQESGNGCVYLAQDTQVAQDAERRKHALDADKVVLKEFVVPSGEDERAGLLFDAVEFLKTRIHPNLARTLDIFSEGERAYVVFEYVPGDSLQTWCSGERVRLTDTQVYDWSLQLSDGLTGLHDHNSPYIFPGLDTTQVIVGPGGQLKIVGYDLRRLFKKNEDGSTPMVFSGHRDDVRGDIRALGRMVVALMSRVEEAGQDQWAFPLSSRIGIHRVISRCMSHEPDFQYHCVREILDDLCRVDRTQSMPTMPLRPDEVSSEKERWWEPPPHAIFPARHETGRLSFVSGGQVQRRTRRMLMLAYVFAFIALVAIAVPYFQPEPKAAAYTRTQPAVYVIPNVPDPSSAAPIWCISAASLSTLHSFTVPGKTRLAASGEELMLLAQTREIVSVNTVHDEPEAGLAAEGTVMDVGVAADGSQAFVLTRDQVLRVDSASGVLVALPITGVDPGKAGRLAVAPDGSLIAMTRSWPPRLAMVPWEHEGDLKFVRLPHMPGPMAFSPDGRDLWVALVQKGTVVRISTETQEVVQSIRVALAEPISALAISPDGNSLFVGLKKRKAVAVVRLEDNPPGPPGKVVDAVTAAVAELGSVPGALVATPRGQLFVSCWGKATIHVLEGHDLALAADVEVPNVPLTLLYAP